MQVEDTRRARAEALYYAALDAIEQGEPGVAIKLCQQALAVDARYGDAMHALIRAYQDAGELDQGIAVAERLALLDPDDVLAYTSLSILYQRKGLVPEAEAAALKGKLLGWKQQLRASRAPGSQA